MMKFFMFRHIFTKHKVFNSIISNNSIDMMNNLFWFKITPKILLHYKTVFINIITFITKWMNRGINHCIPIFTFSYSSLPMRTIFTKSMHSIHRIILPIIISMSKRFFHFFYCFFQMMFSIKSSLFAFSTYSHTFIRTKFGGFYFIWFKIKFFSTYQTFFNHFISKIKAVFRSSMRERLSPPTLLTAKFRQNKIAPSLTILSIAFILCLSTNISFAQDSSEGIKTWVEEEDGSPSIIVYKLKVGNSELTDNADGTASLAGGSGDITTVGDITSGAAFDGTQGNTLTFKGATSGTTALKPTAIAGTTTITLPAETGTACTTGSVCSGYQASGAVTSVTGTSPITSSGGVTPAIGIPKGNSTTDGYINATDWTTFNDKLNTTLASANIYVGNATNITTAVAMSGDVAIDNAGATTIQANSVALGTDTTNNYVATVADSGAAEVTVSGSGSETAAVTLAIASGITRDTEWDTWTEHPTLLSTQILVGNATNVTTNVTVSGDGLLSNTGALTVNDDSHAHTSTTLPATVSYLGSTINETEMSFSNITTLNANTTQHGFMPYLNNNASTFMDGTGNWTAASVSPAGSNTQVQYNNNSALGASSSLTFTPATEDSYTKFLAHTDGTDGSTTFTDEAGIAITANGNAQIDTAQSKFGGASGLLDGTGDYLTTPDSDNYNFGSGDFSVDFQVRFNSVASNQDFIAHWTDGSTHSWEIFWTTSYE